MGKEPHGSESSGEPQGGWGLEAHEVEEDAAVIWFVQPAEKSGLIAVCDHLKELKEKWSQAPLGSAQTRGDHHHFSVGETGEKILPRERG